MPREIFGLNREEALSGARPRHRGNRSSRQRPVGRAHMYTNDSGSVSISFCSLMILVFVLGSASVTHAGKTPPASSPPLPNVDSLRTQDRINQLVQWGEFALANNRFSEAEARFNEVLRLDWNHPRAYRLLQETRRQRTQTLSDWERVGQAAQSRGDVEFAIQNFERILAEDSTRTGIRNSLARLQKRLQADRLIQTGLSKFILEQYAAASGDFEQALAIVPTDTLAALYRERAVQKMAGASSMADLRADSVMWIKYSDALKRLRAGDLPGAERLWQEVLAKYPGNEAVRSNLEQIALRRKQELTSEEIVP